MAKSSRGATSRTKDPDRLKLTRKTKVDLYAARQYLPLTAREESGLRIHFDVYFKDPLVARKFDKVGFDDEFTTPWEPGLRDGPTSARFVVVDYNATTNTLVPPAVWDEDDCCYRAPDGTILDRNSTDLLQFHQLNVWAIVQNTLDYFESGFGLGRRITWAFEGSRLIIVPHAGMGENAYYDRASKSLQLYWFDTEVDSKTERVYTCLSSDIINHEFGHAMLDGLRPCFYETVDAETAAFHEFTGDLTAVLMAFRNNGFRHQVLAESNGDLTTDTLLSGLAQQFGEAVQNEPYMRSAHNRETMSKLKGNLEPHALSEVLTGAMFDILLEVFRIHREKQLRNGERKPSDRMALAHTVRRMQTMAIQPLDLLPPCAASFRDYALAVLRAEEVANPTDPDGYRAAMFDVFVKRGILKRADRDELLSARRVFERRHFDVFHSVNSISASRGGAYLFLDDNRDKLLIPPNADLIVTEITRANKLTTDARRLPDQIVVQYIWREEVPLAGERFGSFDGERTSMLCGGTIVLDENGNEIHWVRKPGTTDLGNKPDEKAEREAGLERRDVMLDTLAQRIKQGMVGDTVGAAFGILERASPPFCARRADGLIRFELAPHFSIREDKHNTGDRQWQISF